MKLNYNIIWIDDKGNTRPFKLMVEDIKRYLSDLFFNCTIDVAEEFEEFKNKFNTNLPYDLVITDLSLNNGSTGKEVIDYIRYNKHNYTEIFFYSANSNFRRTNLINNNRITFYQLGDDNYKELEREIKELIELTVNKFQHIVAMRGMIMHETSTLDSQMLNIIEEALKNKNIDFNELATKIYDELNALYLEKIDFVNGCRDSVKFKNLTKDTFVFSAEYKIRTLGMILNCLNLNDFSSEYKDEINTLRNKFAHAVLLKDENGREYFKYGKNGLTFDEDFCRKIRQNINKHKLNFDTTMKKISEGEKA